MKKFLLCFFICISSISGAQGRFSIAGTLDGLELLNNPKAVSSTLDKNPVPGYPKALYVAYDYHCLADISIQEFKDVIHDREKYVDFIPRLLEYSWKDKILDDGTKITIEEQTVGVSFLGIRSAYHYSLNTREIEDKNNGDYLIKWSLNSSFDGEIGNITGGWYFTEITIEGKKYTYMRYFNDTLFLSPPGYTKIVFKMFASGDMKKLLMSLIKQSENIKRS